MTIVLAAGAPMMTTRYKKDTSNPWKWLSTGSIHAYFGDKDKQVGMIGQKHDPTGDELQAKLIINSTLTDHILFKNNDILGRLRLNGNGILLGNTDSNSTLTNSIILGNNTNNGSQNTLLINPSAQDSTGTIATIGASSPQAIAIGHSAQVGANSANSISFGQEANAVGKGSIAIGSEAKTTNEDGTAAPEAAIAIGSGATANWDYSVAIGKNASATNNRAIAIGYNTSANNVDSIAIGGTSNGASSTALGSQTRTTESSIAIGAKAEANALSSIAIGSYAINEKESECITKTDANGSIAIGHRVVVNSNSPKSLYIGYEAGLNRKGYGGTKNDLNNSILIGTNTYTSGENSIAIGTEATVRNHFEADMNAHYAPASAIAMGNQAVATGPRSIAIGKGANTGKVSKQHEFTVNPSYIMDAIAIGTDAASAGGIAIGLEAVAGRGGNIALGTEAVAYGRDAIAIGSRVTAIDYEIKIGGSYHTVTIGGTPVTSSDKRLKNVGKEFTAGLDKIRELKVFNFTYKDDKTKTPRVGVIAQDLQKVFPSAVKKDSKGYLSVRMEDMFYAVINAIKELDVKFNALRKENEQLKKENLELKKSNSEILKRLEALEQKIK